MYPIKCENGLDDVFWDSLPEPTAVVLLNLAGSLILVGYRHASKWLQ
jgi:hypothetical protein